MNLSWHLPATLHPDEHVIVNRVLQFGTGDLNPHFFVYGSLFMYLSFALCGFYFLLGYATGAFASLGAFAEQYFLDPTWFFLIPRAISAMSGSAAILMAYMLGRQLHSRRAGILAASFLALYADHVRESHYALPAVLGGFLVGSTLVTYLGAHSSVPQTGGTRRHFWCLSGVGMLAGLAVSAHWLAAIGIGVVLLDLVLRSLANWRQAFLPASLLMGGFIVGLFVGEPFLFLDWPSAYRQIFGWTASYRAGGLGLHSLSALLGVVADIRYSLGALGSVCLIFGVVSCLWKGTRQTRLLTVVAMAYVLYISKGGFAPPRYVMIIAPLLTTLAGVGGALLWQRLEAIAWPKASRLSILLVLVTLLEPAYGAFLAGREFGLADTRVLSQEWIHSNIAPGARLLLDGPDANLPRLMETTERLRELEELAADAASEAAGSYPGLGQYYHYKALAAERADEPTYWILRMKHGWWSSGEADNDLAREYGLTPPTTHLGPLPLEDYVQDLGIEYVVSNSWQWREYDKPSFPAAQDFYRALRAYGVPSHSERPSEAVRGPIVQIWRLDPKALTSSAGVGGPRSAGLP